MLWRLVKILSLTNRCSSKYYLCGTPPIVPRTSGSRNLSYFPTTRSGSGNLAAYPDPLELSSTGSRQILTVILGDRTDRTGGPDGPNGQQSVPLDPIKPILQAYIGWSIMGTGQGTDRQDGQGRKRLDGQDKAEEALTMIDPERIKQKNWSRKHKRQKGILSPWKWGYASRSRGSRGTGGGSPNKAADEIRAMFEGKNK